MTRPTQSFVQKQNTKKLLHGYCLGTIRDRFHWGRGGASAGLKTDRHPFYLEEKYKHVSEQGNPYRKVSHQSKNVKVNRK